MKKRGFTLIELLASLAIISVLILVVSSLFSIAINLTGKSYENELDYKEYSYACLYVDNIVRSAYKIDLLDEPNDVTNFVAYVKNPNNAGHFDTYVFDLKENSDGSGELVAYMTNISTYSSPTDAIRQNGGNRISSKISKCQSAKITYEEGNIIHIIINENSQKFRYESKIYLGNRL
ncbi:prepilin-type N-terminal cleavage/methylation domain-containing protein [Anaerococcus provencensis]|uniref:prepilin-type N-terminal cleavage/methylation domain-containing protein n=1 Tax=Anaerococcus provencensis TaxID=938293 RepID=UPI00031186A7|nr:prepilin-type N-terminal cleavage/methylation domain-containing protein [Anaerococcus provencensis]